MERDNINDSINSPQERPSSISKIVSFFLKGLAIVVPIGLSVYAVVYIVLGLDTLIPWFRNVSPGIGFLLVLVSITLIGYVGDRFLISRWLFTLFDYLLEKIPGIKFIYSGTKDVMASFVGDKKKFTNPVWVQVQEQPVIYRIGFLTQEEIIVNHKQMVSVYLPHAYAISGWVIVISSDRITRIHDMTPAEAMKFAVSGGVAGVHHEHSTTSTQIKPNQP